MVVLVSFDWLRSRVRISLELQVKQRLSNGIWQVNSRRNTKQRSVWVSTHCRSLRIMVKSSSMFGIQLVKRNSVVRWPHERSSSRHDLLFFSDQNRSTRWVLHQWELRDNHVRCDIANHLSKCPELAQRFGSCLWKHSHRSVWKQGRRQGQKNEAEVDYIPSKEQYAVLRFKCSVELQLRETVSLVSTKTKRTSQSGFRRWNTDASTYFDLMQRTFSVICLVLICLAAERWVQH